MYSCLQISHTFEMATKDIITKMFAFKSLLLILLFFVFCFDMRSCFVA